MAEQLQLSGASGNYIALPAALTNTLDGSGDGDWYTEQEVYFDGSTALQRLYGGVPSGNTNRAYYKGNGTQLVLENSLGDSVIWNSLTDINVSDFNILRFVVSLGDTLPSLYVNGVLQTVSNSAGSFKTVPAIGVLGVNFSTYSNLSIRSFSYIDNLNGANSRVLSFDGELATPPISETANGQDPTIEGTGHVWSTYLENEPTETPQGFVTIGTVDVGENTANVNFTYSEEDATSFEYRIDGGVVAATDALTSTTVNGLSSSTSYTIEVRAVNTIGDGSWSSVSSFTTQSEPVATPTITSVTDIKLGESFTITTNGDEDLSSVTVTATLGGVALLGEANKTVTTVDFDTPLGGLNLSTAHDLVITVNGAVSNAFSVVVNPPTGHSFVELVSIDNDSWLAEEPFNGDGLSGATAVDAPDIIVYENLNGTVTIDSTGIPTTDSSSTETQTINWFYLESSESYDNSNVAPLSLEPTVVVGDVSQIDLSGLDPSTDYDIKIRAVNAAGSGAWSATEPFTTSAEIIPTSPQGSVVVGIIDTEEDSATVNFTYNNTDQVGFEYRVGGGIAVSIGDVNQFSVSSLVAATAYQVEVRAVNAVGNGTWSAVSNFTTNDVTVVPTTSMFSLVGTGTPDGTYTTKFYDDVLNVFLVEKTLTFVGGDTSTTLSVPPGNAVHSITLGSNPPTTGIAYVGVTV